MAPLESLGTVSYSQSITAMAVSSAVSTQYMNETDRQTLHDSKSHAIQPLRRSRTAKMIRKRIWPNKCHPVKTLLQYYGKSLEALPGVAYPGFRDNRSTLNTKTGCKKRQHYSTY